MKLNRAITNTRKLLGESQVVFGKRFGVSHASISDWEAGKTEAPYLVIGFCFEYLLGGKAILEDKQNPLNQKGRNR